MQIIDDIPFEIDPRTVFSTLHLDPNGPYADEVNGLIEGARAVARPRALYKVAGVRDRESDAVVLVDGSSGSAPGRFVSRVLRVHLAEVQQVFPYVATCGPELDALPIAAGDVFAQFCRDTIKEMALWAAVGRLYQHLGEEYGTHALASLNPGSGDAKVWPIEQQRELFSFLGDVHGSVGVQLTESCLMLPNKSVSGIFYPSAEGFENCELCRQERCPNRRAPFNAELWAKMFD